MKLRKILSIILLMVLILSQFAFLKVNNVVYAIGGDENSNTKTDYNRYYYNQLVENSKEREVLPNEDAEQVAQKRNVSRIAIGIYDAMYEMYIDGVFKQGNVDYNLTRSGHVETKDLEDKNTLLSAYGAARDAFQYDYPDVFYVDFSYLSIRIASDSTGTFAYLGTGRKDSYLLPGFTSENVGRAVEAYEKDIAQVVNEAKEVKNDEDNDGDLTEEKVTFVHDYITEHMIYRYEDQVTAGNARTAFDALHYGEGVCEAYSRAFKAVLDRLDIPCIVVAGIYKTEKLNEAHAWNYVKLSDDKWYGVDVTHDDPTNKSWTEKNSGHETRQYCLVGQSELAGHHIPVGILSGANHEFDYPVLSIEAPRETTLYVNEDLDSDLKVKLIEDIYQDEDGKLKSGTMLVSYRGMNYTDNAKEGYYIVAKYYQYNEDTDSWTEVDWAYLTPEIYASHDDEGFEPDKVDSDIGKYVRLPFPHVMRAQFAVTTIPPDTTQEGILKGGLIYQGDPNLLMDVSSVIENKWGNYVAPPYPKTVTPYQGGTLNIGGTYHIKATYDDVLIPDGTNTQPKITLDTHSFSADAGASTGADYSTITDFYFDGVSTIEFNFTPSKQYADNMCYYTMNIEGLIGQKSKKKPFYLSYGCAYPCAAYAFKAEGYDWNVMGQPQLLDAEDIQADEWVGKDNEEIKITDKLTHRLTLVTTEPSPAESHAMEQTLEGKVDGEVLETNTYNISLSLCKSQIVKTGQGVRVCVGFPKGYNFESLKEGVTFKAYHYIVDPRTGELTDQVEEIECVVTELGLIITCKSFSPFAIAAVQLNEKETVTDKTIVVTSSTNGTITDAQENKVTNLTLKQDEQQTLKVTANDGYQIDSVVINGKTVDVAEDGTITIKYGDYEDANIMVSATFVTKAVVEKEKEIKNIRLLTENDIEVKVESETLEINKTTQISVNKIQVQEETEDIKDITYTSNDDTVVSVSADGVITALKPGKVTITVTINGDIHKTLTIEVPSILGDINYDGRIDSADASLALEYNVNNKALDEKQIALADVNQDGRVNSQDASLILQMNVGLITEFPTK